MNTKMLKNSTVHRCEFEEIRLFYIREINYEINEIRFKYF